MGLLSYIHRKLMSYKRRTMREEQREKQKAVPQVLAETKQVADQAEQFIKTMLTRFEEQYNHFLGSPDNRTPALKVGFLMDINRTSVAEVDLRNSPSTIAEELYRNALRDTNDPTKIIVMYLRIDKVTTLKPNHNLTARPGAAEQLIDNMLTGLLYHAAVLLMNPPSDPVAQIAHVELEAAAAKRRLTDDLITHLFVSGIQFQESSNERQWQLEYKMQTSAMKEKAKEVNDIFENAANMKVNSN